MDLAGYVGTLNLLGDESRLRLCALLRARELSVTDLVRVTGISQSRVSTHLARLREGGFVRDRRDGQHSYYALALDTLPAT
ncbi:MAG TPA: metalloregulator ArsR/SmtB family transcription factor, partial [Labilithrix sp.]|nr:metalloregulator ArsR/SmtB family transcription factor [Labilithrix sp.]